MENKDAITTLNEIKSKGYIQPKGDNILSCYKQINHALADFFKATPIASAKALECMDTLVEICKNTPTFFSLFPKAALDLYDWAATGNLVTQRFAETKLLLFFANISPSSVEQKNRLLDRIQQMPDWQQRKQEVAKVMTQLMFHYDQNGQFNEDPGLSVLKSVSSVLHQVCHPSSNTITRKTTSYEKSFFRDCADMIKGYAPDLYEPVWQEKFAPPAPRRNSTPVIKEAADAYSIGSSHSINRHFSRMWDKE